MNTLKKMGRPTENPKTHRLEIRISDSEKKMIDECCNKTQLSKADVIRLGIEKLYQTL